MTKKRYALHPGKVMSRSDGNVHDIDASTLVRLYGVNMAECVIWDDERRRSDRYSDYVHLFPKASGEYTLPGA